MDTNPAGLKARVHELARSYHRVAHQRKAFEPGKTRIAYSGHTYDHREIDNAIDAVLDFQITAGHYADRFRSEMVRFFDCADFLLVNSGSSANLLMVSTLCSSQLGKHFKPDELPALQPGDEVIAPAVTFPTTLTPLVQNRLVPVFVDCDIGTYNVNPELIEEAIGPLTRAMFIPHTLGNPCDMDVIGDVARRNYLWVLEDSSDALGATFNGQFVGTFGAMASLSFDPAHLIAMGEGGGVIVNHPGLRRTARSLNEWGRDCWCDPGKSNTCGERFGWQLADMGCAYDHKYVYSNIGYSLRVTDVQAAIGLAQLDKFEESLTARRRNFWELYKGLKELEDYLILPTIDSRANPSPFGFPVTVREGIDRGALIRHLEAANIETRLVFGGNILRQPAFANIPRRFPGSLHQSDLIMRDTLLVGVYPGLTNAMLDYVVEAFKQFFRRPRSSQLALHSPDQRGRDLDKPEAP
ncbi:MAG TPA: lipopolysaccharide biosynthesis protein RfbH [Dehalococcoidia bacterium]|nr:lipopolysaccharide biosynthesis protein RfbH [Dehalococcoidia bacterium]